MGYYITDLTTDRLTDLVTFTNVVAVKEFSGEGVRANGSVIPAVDANMIE